MNEKNFKGGLLIILVSIFILSVLFFIGDFFIGGKGGNLCNIFFGFIMVILGLSYLLVSILLNNFGVKVSAKVLSHQGIYKSLFRDRCYVTYNVDGKCYKNWVIGKRYDSFIENEEISILVLKKYPRIVMSKYQNNLFMVIMMLIILIVGLCIIFGNLAVLF